MSIKLDLKQFKHVKSDDKSTTLQHADGHQLTLAHKALSKESQGALQALAKMSQDAKTPVQEQEQTAKMASGGKVKEDKLPRLSHIKAPNTPSGVKQSNEDREKFEVPYGRTIQVPSKDEEAAANHGKVRKMYADPQGPVSEDDAAPAVPPALDPSYQSPSQLPVDTQPLPQAAQESKGLPNEKQAVNDHYNDIIQKRFSNMINPQTNQPYDIEGMKFKDGKPPQDFNEDAYKQGEEDYKAQANQELGAAKAAQQQVEQKNAVRAKAGVPLLPGDPSQLAPPEPQLDPNTPQTGPAPDASGVPPQPQAPQDPNASTDPNTMLQQGYKNQMAGIQGEAQAKGALGEQQAQAMQQQATVQKQAQDHYQSAVQGLNTERQNFIDDIRNGHINPEQYWTGTKDPKTGNIEGGHSKVAAGIGMILAGFNPTSNPNAAINFLKYQMDKNMEGQVQNLGAKKTLLEANLRQFQNVQQATEMTRLMQNDALMNQIQMAAAKAQTPMAKAAAQNALGALQQESSQRFRQLSLMNAMTNIAKDPNAHPDAMGEMLGYMRAVNPEMAKTYEPLYVPGIGLAKVPVPQEVRDKLTGFQTLNDQAKDLLNFTQKNTTLVPGTAAYNVGAQKALTLQSSIREGKLGTVYKAGEQPLLDKFVSSNPAGALKLWQTNPQLRELIRSNEAQMNVTKKSYGLPVPQAAPEIQVKDGIQYQKVPGGWKKVK